MPDAQFGLPDIVIKHADNVNHAFLHKFHLIFVARLHKWLNPESFRIAETPCVVLVLVKRR